MAIEIRAESETLLTLLASMRFGVDLEVSAFILQYNNTTNSATGCILTYISPVSRKTLHKSCTCIILKPSESNLDRTICDCKTGDLWILSVVTARLYCLQCCEHLLDLATSDFRLCMRYSREEMEGRLGLVSLVE